MHASDNLVLSCRRALSTTGPMKTSHHMMTSVQLELLKNLHGSVFNDLSDHFLDHDVTGEDDHCTQLIKKISSLYMRTILHHHGRLYTERFVKNNEASKRHQLNKTILFLGQ